MISMEAFADGLDAELDLLQGLDAELEKFFIGLPALNELAPDDAESWRPRERKMKVCARRASTNEYAILESIFI